MSRTSIQFHALPAEIEGFLEEAGQDSSLFATELGGTPLVATRWRGGSDSIAGEDSTTVAIAFTRVAPFMGARSIYAFHKDNPDVLVVEIGRPSDQGLKESWLWATSTDPSTMALWKRISKKLNTLCTTGGTAENLKTGARGSAGNHRFSSGARDAYAAGMRLLPVAGSVVFHPS